MGSTRTSNVSRASFMVMHSGLSMFPVSEGLRFVGSFPGVCGHDRQSKWPTGPSRMKRVDQRIPARACQFTSSPSTAPPYCLPDLASTRMLRWESPPEERASFRRVILLFPDKRLRRPRPHRKSCSDAAHAPSAVMWPVMPPASAAIIAAGPIASTFQSKSCF